MAWCPFQEGTVIITYIHIRFKTDYLQNENNLLLPQCSSSWGSPVNIPPHHDYLISLPLLCQKHSFLLSTSPHLLDALLKSVSFTHSKNFNQIPEFRTKLTSFSFFLKYHSHKMVKGACKLLICLLYSEVEPDCLSALSFFLCLFSTLSSKLLT